MSKSRPADEATPARVGLVCARGSVVADASSGSRHQQSQSVTTIAAQHHRGTAVAGLIGPPLNQRQHYGHGWPPKGIIVLVRRGSTTAANAYHHGRREFRNTSDSRSSEKHLSVRGHHLHGTESGEHVFGDHYIHNMGQARSKCRQLRTNAEGLSPACLSGSRSGVPKLSLIHHLISTQGSQSINVLGRAHSMLFVVGSRARPRDALSLTPILEPHPGASGLRG